MQNKHRWLPVWCTAALMVFIGAFAFIGSPTTVEAQAGPTATPTDRLWLAYAATRDALEEKFSVDLNIVQRWDFEQVEFRNGIDSCVTFENPAEARALYFGWRFLITDLFGRRYEGRASFDTTLITACDQITDDTTGSTASTAAPAAETGNLPAPVAGSGATGAFELGGHYLEMNANTVAIMRSAGMSWAKTQIRYSLGADPAIVAGAINAAHANGFKILLGVVGEPSQMGDYNAYIASYAQFVAGAASLGADAIEIWNEPNIDREWPAGSINGGTYTQLLAASFNAIKGANSSTLVISGAPAPTGFFGAAGCGSGGCNDDVFMQQMAQAGAASYLDCVGLHYNEGIISPTQNSADPRGSYPTYYFSSMLARGYNPFGGKPVCFTELGYLSPEGFASPLPASFGWAADTSLAEHASWLAGAASAAAQSGRVRLMIIWNVDFPFYTATDPMGGYAIYRPDGSCAACSQLRSVMGG